MESVIQRMSSTGWCFLCEIIYSVKRQVSGERQVLSIAFFLCNGIVVYWLLTCPGRESGLFVIKSLDSHH